MEEQEKNEADTFEERHQEFEDIINQKAEAAETDQKQQQGRRKRKRTIWEKKTAGTPRRNSARSTDTADSGRIQRHQKHIVQKKKLRKKNAHSKVRNDKETQSHREKELPMSSENSTAS